MRVFRRFALIPLLVSLAACGTEEPVTPTDKATGEEQISKQDSSISSESDIAAADLEQLQERFAKLRIDVMKASDTPIKGLYELTTNAGVLYSTLEGDHFFTGTLFSLDTDGNYVDLLAAKQQPMNAEKVESFSDDMIVYKAENEKHVITVFTDITCGYCLKLHRELEDYLGEGITVRYLAYPRNGLQNQTAEEMAKIWCAENPEEALHAAKVNRQQATPVGDMAQCRQSVAEQFNLGRELGISGTPAIVLESGEVVGGYVEASQLLTIIEK